MEGRALGAGEKEENVILEFRPQPTQKMIVACLWSHWQEGDESLLHARGGVADRACPCPDRWDGAALADANSLRSK
jgi:hypothetical protein